MYVTTRLTSGAPPNVAGAPPTIAGAPPRLTLPKKSRSTVIRKLEYFLTAANLDKHCGICADSAGFAPGVFVARRASSFTKDLNNILTDQQAELHMHSERISFKCCQPCFRSCTLSKRHGYTLNSTTNSIHGWLNNYCSDVTGDNLTVDVARRAADFGYLTHHRSISHSSPLDISLITA